MSAKAGRKQRLRFLLGKAEMVMLIRVFAHSNKERVFAADDGIPQLETAP